MTKQMQCANTLWDAGIPNGFVTLQLEGVTLGGLIIESLMSRLD